jgi:hypothetical protein
MWWPTKKFILNLNSLFSEAKKRFNPHFRKRASGDKPLNGARIVGCTHVTAQAGSIYFKKYWYLTKSIFFLF